MTAAGAFVPSVVLAFVVLFVVKQSVDQDFDHSDVWLPARQLLEDLLQSGLELVDALL